MPLARKRRSRRAGTALGAALATAATLTATGALAGASTKPQPPLRYRPIGCRVTGTEVAYAHGPSRREVALSFDDGPSSLTQRFVRMLRANGAVATFFMIGEQINPGYRATLREELRNGDALGDHTWTHPDLLQSDEVFGQLKDTREVIRRETGYTPCVFRPPYGDYDSFVIATARSLGLATILWDVDPATTRSQASRRSSSECSRRSSQARSSSPTTGAGQGSRRSKPTRTSSARYGNADTGS